MASVSLLSLRQRCRRGSILGRTLIAFCIAVMLVPLCMTCILCLGHMLDFNEAVQDEIAALQLRRILLISYDLNADSHSLQFTYQNREMELVKVNRHIILTPGTQIFFADVDSCSFSVSDNVVSVMYDRDGKEYSKALARLP